MKDIERPHRKEKNTWDKSGCIGNDGSYQTLIWSGHIATLYGQIMNHESGKNINLGHDIIKRKPTVHQSIEQKDSFEKSHLSMV
jgi:hypothetical protein